MWVDLAFAVHDEAGACVSEPGAELGFVAGRGALLPRLETALEGLTSGARKSVTLRPEEAFGPRRRDAVLEVDRGELPDDLAEGDALEFEREDGALLVMRVLQVGDDYAVLDANHPLAGQRVRYDLEVRGVRPASAVELEAADRALERDAGAGDELGSSGLLPAAHLVRGRSRA